MTDPYAIDDQARGLYEWDRRIALINRVRELEAQRDAVLALCDRGPEPAPGHVKLIDVAEICAVYAGETGAGS